MTNTRRSTPATLAAVAAVALTLAAPARAADPIIEVRTSAYPSIQVYLRAPDSAWATATATVAFARRPDDALIAATDALAEAHRTSPGAPDLPPLVEPSPATVPAQVIPFDAQTHPSEGILLVLLVDDTASMPGRPIESVVATIEALVETLRPHDRIAVLAFTTETRVVQAPTGDGAAAVAAVRALALDGDTTYIYSSVNQAISTDIPAMQHSLGDAFPRLPERRYLIVFSDGLDERSPVPVDDLLTKLGKLDGLGLGLQLFTVGVGSKVANHRDLQRLADGATLGPNKVKRHFNRPKPADLAAAYREASSHLAEQLRIDFSLPIDYALDSPIRAELQLSTHDEAVVSIPLTLVPGALTLEQRERAQRHREALDNALNWAHARRERDETLRLAAIGGVAFALVVLVSVLVRRSVARRHADQRQAIDRVQAGLDEKLRDVGQQIAGSEQAIGDRLKQYKQQVSDESRRALATLAAIEGPLRGRRYGITRQPCIAGRDDSCDIVFPADTDPAISRRHAEFRFEDGHWRVLCLAAGGLGVNEETVRKGDIYTLTIGDRLRLGKTVFHFGGPA